MTAYNGMSWIKEQLESILCQQGVYVTLFISVDRSTDGTENWVAQFADIHSNVVMLPYGQYFGGAGPNFFRLVRDVDVSDFDAVAFADQDDIWFENKLQRACGFIRSGQCAVYSSNVTAFWPDGRQALIDKAQPQKKFDHFFEAAGPGCTYVFDIASYQDFRNFVIGLKEKIKRVSLHDWFAYAFCRNRGFVWYIDEWPSLLYRQHETNQIGINSGFEAFIKRASLIKQHWYRQQVELIIELVSPGYLQCFRSYFYRLINIFSIRRRPRDALVLFFIFLLGVY